MTSCKNCRALEFISDGIKRGVICNIKLSEPRYNCAFSNKIVLVNGEPSCENCKDKTTKRKGGKR